MRPKLWRPRGPLFKTPLFPLQFLRLWWRRRQAPRTPTRLGRTMWAWPRRTQRRKRRQHHRSVFINLFWRMMFASFVHQPKATRKSMVSVCQLCSAWKATRWAKILRAYFRRTCCSHPMRSYRERWTGAYRHCCWPWPRLPRNQITFKFNIADAWS